MHAEDQQSKEFDQLWMRLLSTPKTDHIEYDCKFPKYAFLRYLVEHREVVLHGSPNPDLDVLGPRKATGTGPDEGDIAVYATEDAAEAIFVATLDRTNVSYWDLERPPIRYAVELRDSSKGPLIDGVVYILNRAPFQRKQEFWVCLRPVVPMGKVAVGPQDFPFLGQVETISAEENDAYYAVKDILCGPIERERVTSRRDPEGYSVVIQNSNDWTPILRLYMTTEAKSLGLVKVDGSEERLSIHGPGDIGRHADRLKAAVVRYFNPE